MYPCRAIEKSNIFQRGPGWELFTPNECRRNGVELLFPINENFYLRKLKRFLGANTVS